MCIRDRFEPAFSQGCYTTTIDELISSQTIPVPNHIKIDVDGIENNIIKGARQTLKNPILRSLLIEVNENSPRDISMIKDLEALVDEYFEAAGVDPRRLALLGGQILDLARNIGLDKDCGIAPDAKETEALGQLDNFLCELKEMQIRDGLHVFGQSPDGERRTDLLVALARVPRNAGKVGVELVTDPGRYEGPCLQL